MKIYALRDYSSAFVIHWYIQPGLDTDIQPGPCSYERVIKRWEKNSPVFSAVQTVMQSLLTCPLIHNTGHSFQHGCDLCRSLAHLHVLSVTCRWPSYECVPLSKSPVINPTQHTCHSITDLIVWLVSSPSKYWVLNTLGVINQRFIVQAGGDKIPVSLFSSVRYTRASARCYITSFFFRSCNLHKIFYRL